jgi:hypothetical protein
MFQLLTIMCLSNALAIFLGCRPINFTISLIEEDGPTWIVAKMKQCLLASSRLDLELLTSYRVLFILAITSCCARAILLEQCN